MMNMPMSGMGGLSAGMAAGLGPRAQAALPLPKKKGKKKVAKKTSKRKMKKGKKKIKENSRKDKEKKGAEKLASDSDYA